MAPVARLLDQRVQNSLRRLEWQLRHRRVEAPLAGENQSVFRGRGMEFDQVVRYAFGDDIRDVDWNVTARLGDLHRKLFVEEREATIVVVVSDDPALQFGSGATSKRDILLELAGLTLMLGVITRARAGLLHATPSASRFFAPTRRRAQILASVAALFAAPTPDPTAGSGGTFSPLVRHPLPRAATVVWLGEVPSVMPPAEWVAFRRRHQVIGIRVEDEWERTGPSGSGLVAYDPTIHDLVRLDGSTAGRAAHARWREAREQRWSAWWPDPASRLVVDAHADPLDALVGFLRSRSPAGRRPTVYAR